MAFELVRKIRDLSYSFECSCSSFYSFSIYATYVHCTTPSSLLRPESAPPSPDEPPNMRFKYILNFKMLSSGLFVSHYHHHFQSHHGHHLHHQQDQEHHIHLAQQHEHQSRFHEVSSSSVLLLGVRRFQVKAKQRFTMESESSFFCKKRQNVFDDVSNN